MIDVPTPATIEDLVTGLNIFSRAEVWVDLWMYNHAFGVCKTSDTRSRLYFVYKEKTFIQSFIMNHLDTVREEIGDDRWLF